MTGPATPGRLPGFGELAPRFTSATDLNPSFHFHALGGCWMVLFFYGSLSVEASRLAHNAAIRRHAMFDDVDAYFFGVSIDPQEAERGWLKSARGVRYFRDFDASVSRLYGVAGDGVYVPTIFLIDRTLRVVASAPASQMDAVLDRLEAEVKAERAQPRPAAPVLTIPRVFEPEFCAELIDYYRTVGGTPSGQMSAEDGMTVGRIDHSKKRRSDVHIEDEALRLETLRRISDRLIPMVELAYGWRATRIERHMVACYSGEERGFFFPHRDNTTPGTLHRKFAVTLNLNAEDYEGGELRFPEFGPALHKPPTGGATVFSCSLLHEARPVTRGERYAYLPFLYDEAGRKVRQATAHTIVHLGKVEPEAEAAS